MEFLVEIDVTSASADDRLEIARLLPDERAAGHDLIERGHIVRIWRLPGTHSNVGIWRAEDATQLHSLLRSLPLFPWTTIRVRALAVHDLEAADDPGT